MATSTSNITGNMLSAYVDALREFGQTIQGELVSPYELEDLIAFGLFVLGQLQKAESRVMASPPSTPHEQLERDLKACTEAFRQWSKASEELLFYLRLVVYSSTEVKGYTEFKQTIDETKSMVENCDLESQIAPFDAKTFRPTGNPNPERYGV